MFRPSVLILAVALSAAGCGRDAPPKTPTFSEVLPNLPLPPSPTFVSKSGGADAMQITVQSPLPVDAVAEYYRKVFKRDGWRLVNDAKTQDGAVVLFAEQKGPPIWVRIRTADDGKGTLVDLAGARLTVKKDSAGTATPAGPKPTS